MHDATNQWFNPNVMCADVSSFTYACVGIHSTAAASPATLRGVGVMAIATLAALDEPTAAAWGAEVWGPIGGSERGGEHKAEKGDKADKAAAAAAAAAATVTPSATHTDPTSGLLVHALMWSRKGGEDEAVAQWMALRAVLDGKHAAKIKALPPTSPLFVGLAGLLMHSDPAPASNPTATATLTSSSSCSSSLSSSSLSTVSTAAETAAATAVAQVETALKPAAVASSCLFEVDVSLTARVVGMNVHA